MHRGLGRSVFVSTFPRDEAGLASRPGGGDPVFTSLHIAEEFDGTFAARARAMCLRLAELGYEVVADVSKRTLDVFGESDVAELALSLRLSALRLDYGFSLEETEAVARRVPVCLNASTLPPEHIARVARSGARVVGMHNYYPRPETGLDDDRLAATNRALAGLGVEAWSFVAGDLELRGPLRLGLPTAESHRGAAPYAAYVDSLLRLGAVGVMVGDGPLGDYDAGLARSFAETGTIALPVDFLDPYRYLEGTAFTVRADSPARVLRLQESREYATAGARIDPYNALERKTGSVTMDNAGYLRYSGEIQVTREDLPADPRVNVIGRVPPRYSLLLRNCAPGARIKFAPPEGR
ncbi:MAG: DUF871 domain-containing protein [Spirochaetae bacterium HGW-Spirochaetae-3]|jgi:hypothetical protein|nr:MAG: DUF871 domain-containing protein [Spirochaetae bacterium HGW-Spirochaetae-3]